MRLIVVLMLFVPALLYGEGNGSGEGRGLTIVALGNTGENGSILRGNSAYLADMYTGAHDAGTYDILLLLGNSFFETGLNVPQGEVDSKVRSLLGPFNVPMTGLGREHVHAVPGSHDYYARPTLERSVLFGLFTVSEGAEGISDRGNQRAAELGQWTYHHAMPAQAVYPVAPGGAPSPDSVQLIFFDSALLLRTDPASWHTALDSLRTLLRASAARTDIAWRLLCTHHPLKSVGEHAGYSLWNEEQQTVDYLPPCDRDSNASGWLRNWIEPQDLCAGRYRAYADSLQRIVREGGARLHALLASYEYSLQLLYEPRDEQSLLPGVHIISGTGARVGRVRRPEPPRTYTASSPGPVNEGRSLYGFVQIRFDKECMRVVFFNGKNGEPVDMGGGAEQFCIRRDGTMKVGEYVKRVYDE